MLISPLFIPMLRRLKYGQVERAEGPHAHSAKEGTPTMGGVIIILSIVVAVLLFGNLKNIYTQLLLLTTLWCGGIGFADDYIKVFKHDKEGMSPRGKLLLQIALGFVIGLTVCFNDDIVVREKVKVTDGTEYVNTDGEKDVNSEVVVNNETWKDKDVVKSTKTTIPFVKTHEFDYKWLSPFKGVMGWYFKWAVYVLMIVVVITACSNGTNLTDGMDGLSAGSSAIVGIVIGVLGWLSGNALNANYLNIMYIP